METLAWMPIELTQGLYALVDGEDYEKLNQHKWYAGFDRYNYYARRNQILSLSPKKQQSIQMHREILDIPDGLDTDHINNYGLDNRKQNLRPCTKAQNQYNQKPQIGCASKYKGVFRQKGGTHKGKLYKSKWKAQIRYNGEDIYLGLFENEIDAAKTYDVAARKYFGEFARLNF